MTICGADTTRMDSLQEMVRPARENHVVAASLLPIAESKRI